MASRASRPDDAAVAAAAFRAALTGAGMAPAGLVRLLRRNGWRISHRAVRGWAEGGGEPPTDLLDWLRALAAHVRGDPLPALPAAVGGRTQRPPEALLDWLRRLAVYFHRNPPPRPPPGWPRPPPSWPQTGTRAPLH
jgi:hypothetical protein